MGRIIRLSIQPKYLRIELSVVITLIVIASLLNYFQIGANMGQASIPTGGYKPFITLDKWEDFKEGTFDNISISPLVSNGTYTPSSSGASFFEMATGEEMPAPTDSGWVNIDSKAANASALDSSRVETRKTNARDQYDAQLVRLTINEDPGMLESLKTTFNGYGESQNGYPVSIYLWDFSQNQWQLVDSKQTTTGTDSLIENSLSTEGYDFVDENSTVYLLAKAKHYNYNPEIVQLSYLNYSYNYNSILDWYKPNDPDNDPLLYEAQMSKSMLFDDEVITSGWVSTTAWNFGDQADGMYYWRVRATDGIAVTPWSETRIFSVALNDNNAEIKGNVNIRVLYENDNVGGVTTWRGVNKGLNRGPGTYNPNTSNVPNFDNLTISGQYINMFDDKGEFLGKTWVPATLTTSNMTRLEFSVNETLTIQGSAKIDASYKGYFGGVLQVEGNGPGKGGAGQKVTKSHYDDKGELHTVNYQSSGGGAGYGGTGGTGGSYGLAVGGYRGSTYETFPQFGSGGGGGAAYRGGHGGGAIRISAGNIVLNGNIFANGSSGSADFWSAGGSGSGGSIHLASSTPINNANNISAAGGLPIRPGWYLGPISGGGGGGRIKIEAPSVSGNPNINGGLGDYGAASGNFGTYTYITTTASKSLPENKYLVASNINKEIDMLNYKAKDNVKLSLNTNRVKLETIIDEEKISNANVVFNRTNNSQPGTISSLKLSPGATAIWNKVTAEGDFPTGTSVSFNFRTATSKDALSSASWSAQFNNNANIQSLQKSEWLEVKATLNSTTADNKPALDKITIASSPDMFLVPPDPNGRWIQDDEDDFGLGKISGSDIYNKGAAAKVGLWAGQTQGTYLSPVFDSGVDSNYQFLWNNKVENGLQIQARVGQTEIPDSSWTKWKVVGNGSEIPIDLKNKRYIQYKALFSSNVFLETMTLTFTPADGTIPEKISGDYTWTSKADFENNASTVNISTVKDNIDTVSLSGSIGLGKKNDFGYYKKILSDKKANTVETANGKFYVATEGKLLIVDRDGVILKNLDIGADTIDSYSDGSKIIVAMTNGKAALIDLATDTIINNQIDMQTDNGAYKVSRIFNLLNNKIYVTQYKTRYVSNGTWEDDKGEIHYYPKTLVSDGFGALIDVQTNTLERRDALGTAGGNNAYKFDFYQPKNHLFVGATIYRKMVDTLPGVVIDEDVISSAYERTPVKNVVYDSVSSNLYVYADGQARYPVFDDGFHGSAFSNWAGDTYNQIIYDPISKRFFGVNGNSMKTYTINNYTQVNYWIAQAQGLTISVDSTNHYAVWNDPTSGIWVASGLPVIGDGFGPSGTIILTASAPTHAKWTQLLFNNNLFAGTGLKFRARTASTKPGLATAIWTDYYDYNNAIAQNLENAVPYGKWIEVQLKLTSEGWNNTTVDDATLKYETTDVSIKSCSQGTLCHRDSTYPPDNFDESLKTSPVLLSGCAPCHKDMLTIGGPHQGLHDNLASYQPEGGIFGGFMSPSLDKAHQSHRGGIDCSSCHHEDGSEDASYGCDECHDNQSETAEGLGCTNCHKQANCQDCHKTVLHAKHNKPQSAKPTCTDSKCHKSPDKFEPLPSCTSCHYNDKEMRAERYIDKAAHLDIKAKHTGNGLPSNPDSDNPIEKFCNSCHGGQSLDELHGSPIQNDITLAATNNKLNCTNDVCHKYSRLNSDTSAVPGMTIKEDRLLNPDELMQPTYKPVAVFDRGQASPNLPNPSTGWTDISSNIGSIYNSDNQRMETRKTTGRYQYDAQLYSFTIDNNLRLLNYLKVIYEGYGESVEGYPVTLYIWNRSTSQWEQLDSKQTTAGQDSVFEITKNSNLTSYINSIGYDKVVYIATKAKHYNYPPARVNDMSGWQYNLNPKDGAWSFRYNWLRWYPPVRDLDGDEVSYYVELSNDSSFAIVSQSSGWISGIAPGWHYRVWSFNAPLPEGVWYWRVKARDNLAEGQWSKTFVFRNYDPIYDDKGDIINASLIKEPQLLAFDIDDILSSTKPKLSLNTDRVALELGESDDRSSDQLRIDTVKRAIRENQTSCDNCHTGEATHTDYLDSHDWTTNADCVTCHSGYSQSNNLATYHENKEIECDGCHNYSGTKLDKTRIDEAIKNANLECSACHDEHDVTNTHVLLKSEYNVSTSTTSCSLCHKTNNVALLHTETVNVSFGKNYNCFTCHDYQGTKLNLVRINDAINLGGQDGLTCDSCHNEPISLDLGHQQVEDKHTNFEDFNDIKNEDGALKISFPGKTGSANYVGGGYKKQFDLPDNENLKLNIKVKDSRNPIPKATNYIYKRFKVDSIIVLNQDIATDDSEFHKYEYDISSYSGESIYFDFAQYHNRAVGNFPAIVYLDEVKVRKFASTEPTCSVGTEESSGSSWWNSSWRKRAKIKISDFQSDYQTKVDISFDDDMRSTFNDIRFIDASTNNELNYWIEEKTDGASATVWFKTGNVNDIYMYYGNKYAGDKSNGKNTFVIFNDFNEGDEDWEYYENHNGFDGSLNIVESSNCYSCHQDRDMTTIHKEKYEPTMQKDWCLVCHTYNKGETADVKQSDVEETIRSNTGPENSAICTDCHKKDLAWNEGHTNLDDSHRWHESVMEVPNTTCQSCHPVNGAGYSCNTCHSFTPTNLSQLHVDLDQGYDCYTCHDYKGTRLNKEKVKNAISTGNKACSACHDDFDEGQGGHINIDESHTFTFIPDACLNCHNIFSGRYRLNNSVELISYHESQVTSYQSFDCLTCHNYEGTRLDKEVVENAIKDENLSCGNQDDGQGGVEKGCHENTDMYLGEHNTMDDIHLSESKEFFE